jgi:hypothetical protein
MLPTLPLVLFNNALFSRWRSGFWGQSLWGAHLDQWLLAEGILLPPLLGVIDELATQCAASA